MIENRLLGKLCILVALGTCVEYCYGHRHQQAEQWFVEGSEGRAQDEMIREGKSLHHKSLHLPFHLFYSPQLPHFRHRAAPIILQPTLTKTVICETVTKHYNHAMCIKTYPGVPPCVRYDKESKQIEPTFVPTLDFQQSTRVLGTINPRVRSEIVLEEEGSENREERHIGIELKGQGVSDEKKVQYVMETLWVTRVEEHVKHGVTATLSPENCVPMNTGIPPCPAKVEHYVHYDELRPIPQAEYGIPVWENKETKSKIIDDKIEGKEDTAGDESTTKE